MEELRTLPKVDVLSRIPALETFPEAIRVAAARTAVDRARSALLSGETTDVEQEALSLAREMSEMSLRPAINGSGIILHTGLGRARLAPSVAAHVAQVAAAHSAVELDFESGKRGDRQGHVVPLLVQLTGAEDALVVNNAAAAIFLALQALCGGREVILSRGQMVEIGGSFRIPDIVRESGCRMVEVGCTNKTHLSDYERAIHEDTGALLRCHTSNYRIDGFTSEVPLVEIARLAHAYGLICIDDMGTGCLADLSKFALSKVPTLRDSIGAKADVVIGSGDKLLGGPQAGLLLGSRECISKIKRHPLARAVRVDKLTVAALEATLRLYVAGRELEIPVIRDLAAPLESVRKRADRLAEACSGTVAEGLTEIGGGSAPGTGVPTWRVAIPGDGERNARRLRQAGVIGRIEDGKCWLDPRTMEDDEVETVCQIWAKS